MSDEKGPGIRTVEVSEKHIKARIAAFILAFIVALAAFVNGFLSIGNTKEGYYDLIAAKDEDAPYYAAGMTYTCLFEGSRGEVRRAVREADDAYSRALSWAYKLCDAESEYPGYVNLATMNRELREQALSAGGPEAGRLSFSLAPELYSALRYAYRWTGQEAGYNLFAGPVNAEWKSIIFSEDPSVFDPALNEYEADRLEKLAAATADPADFNMTFDDADCSVSIAVPSDVFGALDALESDAPLIDFGPLHDAFMTEMALSVLDLSGPLGKGLIRSADGFAADLRDGSIYCAVSRSGSAEDMRIAKDMGDPGIMKDCAFHASAYEAETQDGVLRRDLFFDPLSGRPGSYVILYEAHYVKELSLNFEKHDLAAALYRMLSEASAQDEETLSARMEILHFALSGNVFGRSSIYWETADRI